ncbi:N-acetylmuramoyl-L-alanine amidase [Paracoccus onubensis]|uniref:N-acetylmuramoyl-L-alanine amidase n=1 Tax=Paracoccus onubensis TaxID=1675788 RepID=UPI00272F72A2|nr:N-acetylmuramoyl-L-alanine amidase [Paracoccus onubensis]MDP0926773.1 N-acetylmuramoyl-L-alanine amidase [Paracoccus onubensis]
MTAAYPSRNHGDRRGQRPELIVLHYTGMANAAVARARLCDSRAEVSAHWLIGEAGIAEALVPETRRAWHAGAGAWQGRGDVNSRSIGIEIANPGDRPFTSRQMDALTELLRGIMSRWHIGPASVIAHSDLAPGRKIDPGPRFDWQRLAHEGLALWPDDGPDTPLSDSLDAIGYPACDEPLRLAAFRLRFRPWAGGPETIADRRRAAGAARSYQEHAQPCPPIST